MSSYKQVIDEMLQPEDKLGSVKDTLYTLGEILEAREKVKKGEYFSKEDIDKVIHRSIFTLGYFPFWQVHGLTLRPLLFQAFETDENSVEYFMKEAIPIALIIAMPHRQEDYSSIKRAVLEKLRK